MGEQVPPGRETPIVDRAKADDAGRPPADVAVTQLARQLMEAGLDGLSERERRVTSCSSPSGGMWPGT